ncbi:PepSY-associated TM helix domain-containing protein [Nitrospira sp. KM1]|uniref:PepSY-associated TM helix domain-containing protein n=1 Tax=Nitrospira sp. KM1 TaxID=1936990 RepID=UPI0018DA2A73|nr:PepSY-associated TM helix domain-containing protein [Nitrospira sp. KM1]
MRHRLRWPERETLARLNLAVHRDIGYACASLILAYCLSGIALNHIGDWNPDFVISRQTVSLPHAYDRKEITKERIAQFGRLVQEESYKIYDFPTSDQVKIYYDNASLHLNFSTGHGTYEKVSRRPLLYQANALHLNRLQGWKWASDVFALILILLSLTGLFVLRGRYGLARRGKWLILVGLLPPVLALLIFELK